MNGDLLNAIDRATITRWTAPVHDGEESGMWADRYVVTGTFTAEQIDELRVCEGVIDIGTNGAGANALTVSGQFLRAIGVLRPLESHTLVLREQEPEEPDGGLDAYLSALGDAKIY